MKHNGRGRRIFRTAEEIGRLLAEYGRQEQSVRQFALQHQINPSSFRNWLKKVPGRPAGPRWVEVLPAAAAPVGPGPVVTVEMSGGLKVQVHAGFAAGPVAQLIQLLRQP